MFGLLFAGAVFELLFFCFFYTFSIALFLLLFCFFFAFVLRPLVGIAFFDYISGAFLALF